MFSEELTGNASRKRVEENRARRRMLKEQQQRKEQGQAANNNNNNNNNKPAPTGEPSSSSIVPPPATATTTTAGSTGAHVSTASAGSAAVIARSHEVSPPVPAISSAAIVSPKASAAVPPLLSRNSPSHPLSVVERAEQQRQIRAKLAQQTQAAVAVQSFVRGIRSFRQFSASQSQLLHQRLQDLDALRKFLQAKATTSATTTTYVPPPATVTTLVQQLLRVARPRPSHRRATPQAPTQQQRLAPTSTWSSLLLRTLEVGLLPGIEGVDDTTNTVLVWMESLAGRRRLKELLRLVVTLLFSSSTTAVAAGSNDTQLLLRILEYTMGVGAERNRSTPQQQLQHQQLIQYCRSFLLMKSANDNIRFEPPRAPRASVPSNPVPCAQLGAPLDLILSLRYYLMFAIAGSMPIPRNAQDLREKCVSVPAKSLSGSIFMLILKATVVSDSESEVQLLHSRVIIELFTVPLLQWKLCPATVTALTMENGPDGRIQFLRVLHSFVELHTPTLASGALERFLTVDDVPLTLCPATPSQCLLANLIQLLVVSPTLNGTTPTGARTLDSTAAACEFFSVLCSLLDVIPVSTFSSREASVEWMTDGKGHHTPIVLSSIILEQCKLLLLDSLIRRLVNSAIDTNALNVDAILTTKTDRDVKHEKNLLDSGAASASSLAAKEARIDRNRSFWDSSKWAGKISKGVSSLLSGAASPKTPTSVDGVPSAALLNTTSVSRKLASGTLANHVPTELSPPSSHGPYNPELLYVLCRMYAIVLARWGGGGRDDLSRKASEDRPIVAVATPETCTMSLLNVLGFSTPIISALWAIVQSDSMIMSQVESVVEAEHGAVVRSRALRPLYEKLSNKSAVTMDNGSAVLFLFVSTLAHVLIVTDDTEIHDMDRPLPLHQLRRCIELLKKLLHRACYIDDQSDAASSNYFGLALISASSRAMRDLYDRSSRRPLCIPKLWLVPDLFEKEIRHCKSFADFVAMLKLPVLRVCPFLVSFKRRLKIFERIVTLNRIDIQGINDMNPFNTNPLKPGIPVRITRGRLLEDGIATMNHLGSNMRRRIAVQYVNEAGTQESGIDAGGLFKEFWTDLSGIAFNPNYALFRVTEGAGNCLYPNPSSGAAHGTDHIVLFEFLGRILGKALYEGITIHPCFAHFFLSFLRGDYNYLHMLPDLSTIDPQLYNNLMFLKTFDGDATDLCLTFTVTNDEFGGTTEIPLMPNGSNIEVNNGNKQRYIGLVAKYYVVDRVKEQSEAFTRGLWDVIDRSWLRIFNEPELQVLISGASDGTIDVDDMRANTKYLGGYTGLDRNVSRFWSVVSKLDSQHQKALLRFVTSCERPPPLGFASMNPPFTIQRAGLTRDDGKLPTASTCFNTLKLPVYSSDKVMKERLLYAIQSGAGFELS